MNVQVKDFEVWMSQACLGKSLEKHTTCNLAKSFIKITRPRLHMYVHFAGQNDKKTPKHNAPDALFLYMGQHIKTREESNIPYLSVFPNLFSVAVEG